MTPDSLLKADRVGRPLKKLACDLGRDVTIAQLVKNPPAMQEAS